LVSAPQISTTIPAQFQASKKQSRLILSPVLTVLSCLLILFAITGNLLVYYAGRSQAATLTFPRATRTPTPASSDLYQTATSGTPAFTDALTRPSLMGWASSGSTALQSCNFSKDGVHLTNTTSICETFSLFFTNFAFQVLMTCVACQTDDAAGLIFRDDSLRGAGTSYLLIISSGGELLLTAVKGSTLNPLLIRSNPAIARGQHQANLLTVIARGSQIDIYVNKQHIGQINDQTSPAGAIGFINTNSKHPTDYMFSNAQLWNL
jgi:hypothetical protein